MSSIASARLGPPGDLGDLSAAAARREAGDGRFAISAESSVTALYQAHALSLTRLAHVMLGDKASAEDVVQEAFCGLYRNWARLADPAAALPYLRASVLNGCRSVIRRRKVRASKTLHEPAAASAESLVLTGEEHRSVLAALRQLPARQREVLVMRFYARASDEEIARVMGISHEHGPVDQPPGARRARTAAGGKLMNSLESRIHAAAQAAADEVTPADIPPLRLPVATARAARGRPERGVPAREPVTPQRSSRWLAPLAAAVSLACGARWARRRCGPPCGRARTAPGRPRRRSAARRSCWPGRRSTPTSRPRARSTRPAWRSPGPVRRSWPRRQDRACAGRVLAVGVSRLQAAVPARVPRQRAVPRSGASGPGRTRWRRPAVTSVGPGQAVDARRPRHAMRRRPAVVHGQVHALAVAAGRDRARRSRVPGSSRSTRIQASGPVRAKRAGFVSCLESFGVPARFANLRRQAQLTGSSPASSPGWAGSAPPTAARQRYASQQRLWTPVFVTCARPTVRTSERLQVAARSTFLAAHAAKIRTIKRIVVRIAASWRRPAA